MYYEALKDGVRIEQKKGELMARYYPKCHLCGEEMLSLSYKKDTVYTCKRCKMLEYLSDRSSKADQGFEAKERRFKRAVERIESKTHITKAYRDAAETAYKNLHRDGWFNSTEEIMVAIQLLKSGFKVRHQVKLGRYRADFVLPEHKIVLEVDGVIYHKGKEEKDKLRDQLIVLALGADWEVIRITDKMINENITKVTQAISRVKKHRQKLRELNKGQLPKGYSDTAT